MVPSWMEENDSSGGPKILEWRLRIVINQRTKGLSLLDLNLLQSIIIASYVKLLLAIATTETHVRAFYVLIEVEAKLVVISLI